MQNTRLSSFFRYLAYCIEIIVIHILSNTPNLIPEIFGGKPTILIVIALTISMFEREIPSMIFGLICGLLIDLSYSASVGTFTIGLTIICFLLGYIANNMIVTHVWNMLLCSFIVISVLFSLHFLFMYVLKDYGDNGTYYLNHYLSRIIYTFIFTPAFYFLNKFIHRTLSQDI